MKEEIFYVWTLPNSRTILVEDRGMPPVNATEQKQFKDWFEAKHYGDNKAKELGYRVEYDNEAGRWVESEHRFEG